jgi:hypothetical protein
VVLLKRSMGTNLPIYVEEHGLGLATRLLHLIPVILRPEPCHVGIDFVKLAFPVQAAVHILLCEEHEDGLESDCQRGLPSAFVPRVNLPIRPGLVHCLIYQHVAKLFELVRGIPLVPRSSRRFPRHGMQPVDHGAPGLLVRRVFAFLGARFFAVSEA